jgi:hypothetical protein
MYSGNLKYSLAVCSLFVRDATAALLIAKMAGDNERLKGELIHPGGHIRAAGSRPLLAAASSPWMLR